LSVDDDEGGICVSDKVELAQQYIALQTNRDEKAIDDLAGKIAEDAVLTSPRGAINGRDAIVDRLKNPPEYMAGGGMMGQVTYADPVEEGDTVRISANIPPNPMIKGLTLEFGFDGEGRIKSIETQMER
jgi:hypothetical protein